MNDVPTTPSPVGPAPVRRPGPLRRTSGGVSPREVLIVGVLVGVLCWGAWVTRSLVDSARAQDRFVKLQLQGVISEYLQAQARSGNDDRAAAQATTQFMGELDRAVAALGRSGRVVLVNEAVIGGDIPDVTAAVRTDVYARVPLPAAPPAAPVRENMPSSVAAGGARDGGE